MPTFRRGGIHVTENKHLSEHQPITDLPLPDQVAINLTQHLGKPAKSLVKAKQEVSTGSVIGEADGYVSSHVHSSVSGIVSKIERRLNAVGSLDETVIIDVNKEKTIVESEEFASRSPADPASLDTKILLNKIKDAGIVGEGGATFPTHVKLNPPADKPVEFLIVNGAECEPFLTADHQLMMEQPDKILTGIDILGRILSVKKTYIGIESNKPDAIALFEKRIEETSRKDVQVVSLKTKYPQGGEKQLIQAIVQREVPSGKLPFDVGVLVQNIGTIYSIFEACLLDKPLFERVTTITGFVNKPGNFKLRIGTSFEFAIREGAGGFKDEDRVKEIINGGPMMGKSVRQTDVSIMKGTSGILILSDSDFDLTTEGPCIRCSRCVNACPMGLMPTNLAIGSQFKSFEMLKDVMDCIECGSCSYVCPTNRQLVHWIRLGKYLLRTAK